jgi:hypothetical protein
MDSINNMLQDLANEKTTSNSSRGLSLPDSKLVEQQRVDGERFSPLRGHNIDELREHGHTVVRRAVTADAARRAKDEWLCMLDDYGIGFDRHDTATWQPASHRPMSTRGMHDYPPVAQEGWVWDLRLQCAPVFGQLWQTRPEDLITSMDRVCFLPNSQLAVGKGWMHIDQSRRSRRGALHCMQGMLLLEDIGPGEVALEVISGSHKHHGAFFEHQLDATRSEETAARDWLKLKQDDLDWYEAQSSVARTRIHAKAGDLILWDSRIPHHAVPPAGRSARSTLPRFTVYVSMLPRRLAKADRLRAKRRQFVEGRATSHWPQDSKVFGKYPSLYGKQLPEYPGFELGRQLEKRNNRFAADRKKLMFRLAGFAAKNEEALEQEYKASEDALADLQAKQSAATQKRLNKKKKIAQ